MKIHLFIILNLFLILNLRSQIDNSEFKTISSEQYHKYFPIDFDAALFLPSNDVVYILPTNEMDSIKQEEINKFYKEELIQFYNNLPSQKSRILTDKEALNTDLSDVNIYSFGTAKGNLWTAKFIARAKDFPIKIYNDSIVTDTVYRGNNFILNALWYNPDNYKYSVILYTPQDLNYAKNTRFDKSVHFWIYKNENVIPSSYFYKLVNNKWIFTKTRDTTLIKDCDRDNKPNEHFTRINSDFFKYPSLEQLNSCLITETVAPVDTINLAIKKEDYNGIADMEWMKPITKKYKIISLGESHHLKNNSILLNRVISAVNTFDYYPLLVRELPYSWGAYINYYITIPDDSTAFVFRDSVLNRLGIPSYDNLRIWNKMNPMKIVRVGCSDIEHYFERTIDLILNPYLKKLDPKLVVNSYDSFKGYLKKVQGLINQAKKLNLVGAYPFQTPDYIESVFENLKSSIPIKLDPKKWQDHSDRFKVMIRNVTDTHFLGNDIINEKCIFYGGADHFRNNSSWISFLKKHQEGFKYSQPEGLYLANDFEPTKGQVYTINISTLGLSIEDSIQLINPRLHFDIEKDLIKLYKQKIIKLGEPIVNSYFLSELDEYFYKLSYKYPNYAFRLSDVKFDEFYKLNYSGMKRFRVISDLKMLQEFNTTIFIPYSCIGD
jgi:hypothetical protein